MSNSVYGAVPSGHIGMSTAFMNADGLTGKILLDQQAAAAAGATSPLFYGGASVYDLLANSSDTAARDIQLYRGTVLTTVGGSTGAVSTTTSTVVRSTGSFVADGWRVGRQVMIFAAPTDIPQAIEGVLCTVSGVVALTLSFSGTPLSALSVATGSRIVLVDPMYASSIPIGSGNSGAVAEKWILSSSNIAASRMKDEKFGANQVLIAAMKAAVTATYAVTVSGSAAKY